MLGIKDIHSGHYEDAFINIRGIFLVKNSWEGLERKCFKRCIMIFTKPDIKIIPNTKNIKTIFTCIFLFIYFPFLFIY